LTTNVFIAVRFDSYAPTTIVHREVAERLNPERFRVFAFFKEEANESDLPYHITPVVLPRWGASLKPISTFIKAVQILPKILLAPKDVVHTIANLYFLPLQQIWRLLDFKGKYVITLHGIPETTKLYYTGKILSNYASAVISVSNYTAKMVKKHYGLESQVIYNGVNCGFFRPIKHDNDRPMILYVGRLISSKKPHWVAELAKSFPTCDFKIHGRGPMKSVLEQTAKNLPNLNIDSSFVNCEELRKLYAKSDIFLFPAIDWCPLVTLEAMACGVPLLMNSIGGQTESIEEGKEGMLAKTYTETKRKLQYLIEDENVRKKMGEEARRTALGLDWKYVAKKHEVLYEELAGR
jgi:glycosyltransferase involved in cell wall biosynthesis